MSNFNFFCFRNFLYVFLIFCFSFSQAYSPQEIGLVLIHGKWGIPPGPLEELLKKQGYQVVSPVMAWSRLKNYDATYEQTIDSIHNQVQQLREKGSKVVIIGGLSFGANATLAYLTKFQDVDGAMLFSPGHLPDRFYDRGLTKLSVDTARTLMLQGRSGENYSFTDFNQGRVRDMSSTVAIYLSYFDPNGLANMPKSANSIKKPLPIFCVMSSAEKILGKDYFFSKLPYHALSQYIETNASHMDAPDATSSEALLFVQNLTNQ